SRGSRSAPPVNEDGAFVVQPRSGCIAGNASADTTASRFENGPDVSVDRGCAARPPAARSNRFAVVHTWLPGFRPRKREPRSTAAVGRSWAGRRLLQQRHHLLSLPPPRQVQGGFPLPVRQARVGAAFQK